MRNGYLTFAGIRTSLVKMRAGCAACCVASAFWAVAEGGTLELKVLADGEPRPVGAIECAPAHSTSCAGQLNQVLATIGSLAWRQKLAGKVQLVRVVFSSGVHRISEPMPITWGRGATVGIGLEVIGPIDDGRGKSAIVSGARIVADQGEASISQGHQSRGPIVHFELSGWPPFDSPPSRGFGLQIRPVMTELFIGDKVLSLAGWPNSAYGQLELPTSVAESGLFAITGRRATDWQHESEPQAFGYWSNDWAAQTLPLLVKDGYLKLGGRGSPYGIRAGQRVRVENALSELDTAGEWFLDRSRMRLYVWLPANVGSQKLELSIATELLRIEQSKGVSIRNLAFEKSRGDGIVVKASQNVLIEGVSIRHSGNRALVIEGGERCGIRNSLIEHNGDGGVTLLGGDRQTLTVAGHFAEHNVIRNFSRLSKTYRPAIDIGGVGQRAVGNVISDGQHTAILFAGNDHLIAANEITRVVQETSDAGAIYTGRDYTARGTQIEDNFLHDIFAYAPGREVKGIYLDDQASGVVVRRNVFARVEQPVFIGGGRDNLIEENIFYNSSPALHVDARGIGWNRAATLDPGRELQKRLDAVPYRASVYSKRYPNLARLRDDDYGAPKYNVTRSNVVVNGQPFRVEPTALAGIDLSGMSERTEDVFAQPPPKGGRRVRSDFLLK